MRWTVRLWVAIAMMWMGMSISFAQEPQSLRTVPMQIGGHEFTVEVAVTAQEKEIGLMYRPMMSENHGMVFIYPEEGRRALWMKNTFIPLDMLFVDGQNRIVAIHENARPQDLTIISPEAPARALIELNAGSVQRLGIAVGDIVKSAALDPVDK